MVPRPMPMGAISRRLLVWCGLVFLTSMVSANDVNSASDLLPCWFEMPVSDDSIGQIGLARNISSGSFSPSKLSASRAVASLCGYWGKVCDSEQISHALETETLFGQPIYFAYFESSGYLYTYVALSPSSEKQCPLSSCDIERCDPQWLCSATTVNENSVLGVSYRAATKVDQFSLAVSNALQQAEYMYGVKVEASKSLRYGQASGQTFLLKFEHSDVEFGGKETLPYVVGRQCQSGSTLFRRVQLLGLSVDRPLLPPGDLSWLENPKYLGLDGAVGIVENPLATGLLSDQIDLAVKRAAVELAFEKSSKTRDKSVTVVSHDGGIIQISRTDMSAVSSLQAKVMQFHFAKGSGSFLKVYVWLVLI